MAEVKDMGGAVIGESLPFLDDPGKGDRRCGLP